MLFLRFFCQSFDSCLTLWFFLLCHSNPASLSAGFCQKLFLLPVAAMLHLRKDNGQLLHDQIILYGFDPFHTHCDLPRFIDGLLRINEAVQLDDALAGFDADLE